MILKIILDQILFRQNYHYIKRAMDQFPEPQAGVETAD